MLRSKSSRSAFSDIENKSHEAVLSRTLSSRFCRGDILGKSVEKKRSLDRNPSKGSHITESQIQRALSRQEHMGQLEQELKWAKDRIFVVEEERKQAVDDMREGKRVAENANMKANESAPPKKVGELSKEIRTLKEELGIKDKVLEALRKEVDQAKQFEVKWRESDTLLSRLKEEISKARASETLAMDELSASKRNIDELHDEVQRQKVSETKMLESLRHQTEQLQQANLETEQSKIQISSLKEKIVSLEAPLKQNDEDSNMTYQKGSNHFVPGEENLMISELDQMESLRNELRMALEGEEKSKSAMDDLALALREVATESNHTKEKLRVTESELGHKKTEAEQLKHIIRIFKERYEKLLNDVKSEAEVYGKTVDRLRLEAEESQLTWNAKEMGFISCVKKAEEERAVALHENSRLIHSLKAAQDSARAARDDCCKLRDIIKQAVYKANAAKTAASTAGDENSQLKDRLDEMEEAMHFLALQNERLTVSQTIQHKDPQKTQIIKGSVFDSDASPQSEPCTENATAHHRTDSPSIFTDDEETTTSDDLDHLENSRLDDSDGYINHTRKTMFQRVGSLMKGRSFQRK